MEFISVLTAPRARPYLGATLRSLNAAGACARPRRVFVDGGADAQAEAERLASAQAGAPGALPWAVERLPGAPLGVRRAMRAVLARALDLGADLLLYAEDDVLAAAGAVDEAFAAGVPPGLALVSLWDRKELPGARRLPRGIHDVPLRGRDRRGLHGACALLLPRRSIEWILARPDDWPGHADGADVALSWWLRDSPWQRRGVHVPSLFEHVGDVSSLDHLSGQRAAWFEGPVAGQ